MSEHTHFNLKKECQIFHQFDLITSVVSLKNYQQENLDQKEESKPRKKTGYFVKKGNKGIGYSEYTLKLLFLAKEFIRPFLQHYFRIARQFFTSLRT